MGFPENVLFSWKGNCMQHVRFHICFLTLYNLSVAEFSKLLNEKWQLFNYWWNHRTLSNMNDALDAYLYRTSNIAATQTLLTKSRETSLITLKSWVARMWKEATGSNSGLIPHPGNLEIRDIPYVTHRSTGCGKKPLAVTASGFCPYPGDLCVTYGISRISQVDRMWNEVNEWPLSTSWRLRILM